MDVSLYSSSHSVGTEILIHKEENNTSSLKHNETCFCTSKNLVDHDKSWDEHPKM